MHKHCHNSDCRTCEFVQKCGSKFSKKPTEKEFMQMLQELSLAQSNGAETCLYCRFQDCARCKFNSICIYDYYSCNLPVELFAEIIDVYNRLKDEILEYDPTPGECLFTSLYNALNMIRKKNQRVKFTFNGKQFIVEHQFSLFNALEKAEYILELVKEYFNSIH